MTGTSTNRADRRKCSECTGWLIFSLSVTIGLIGLIRLGHPPQMTAIYLGLPLGLFVLVSAVLLSVETIRLLRTRDRDGWQLALGLVLLMALVATIWSFKTIASQFITFVYSTYISELTRF